MNANPILLQKKHIKVIAAFAEKQNISLQEAMKVYYKSELYHLVSNGVSDLHCMDEHYLAEELEKEIK